MSIVALKRKSNIITTPISRGKFGFSLSGGYRNQGRVGQPLAGRALGGTRFKGNTPIGNGGCCGKYPVNISKVGGCCTNNPNIPKRTSINTFARIKQLTHPICNVSSNNISCKAIWVQDFSPLNNSQGTHIRNISGKAASFVTRKPDAGKDMCSGCSGGSYYIGTKLHVRTPYAKDLNPYPISQGQYIRGAFLNTKDLPTPPCKAHFPPTLNGSAGCVKHTTDPKDILHHKCKTGCSGCDNPGLPQNMPLVSQNIRIGTPLSQYTAAQKSILSGQRIK